MKKLRFAARILLPFFVLIGLVSCKNTIDEMDIKGYRYVLSRIDNPDLNELYLNSYGFFIYQLDFASSGNTVVRTIVTWDNERDVTEGTFSVDKTTVTLSFPESEYDSENPNEMIGMPEENITLSYDKRSGSLVGNFNLPAINPNTDELIKGETNPVYGQLSAISKVSE